MANYVKIGGKQYTQLPVRKSKYEAEQSAKYWRERGHLARLRKATDGKYYVCVRKK